jgi:hypothetical protein
MDAVRNGIYMDTLGLKQSIGLCITDLAKGYEKKFGKGNFILKCCDTVLKYYPNYINALLQKAEMLKTLYVNEKDRDTRQAKQLEADMNIAYTNIHKLGYRKMPKKMYINWLMSLQDEKNKYQNKNVIIFNTK